MSTTVYNPARAMATLITLPLELQLQILSYLSQTSKLNLRITCHHFHALIPHLTLKELIEVEQSVWAKDEGLFTCSDCIRLRPWRFFSENMTLLGVLQLSEGSVGTGGEWTRIGDREKRKCLDCGARPRWARSAWRRA